MKSIRCLTAFLTVSLALAMTARADMQSDYDENEAVDPSVHDPDVAPRAYVNALHTKSQSDPTREKAKKAQQDDANNWLVNAYEHQLAAHAAAAGESNKNNIYATLAADPEMARLAGITPVTPADDSTEAGSSKTLDLRTGVNPGNANLSLRPDPSVRNSSISNPATTSLFQPLITPLSATESAGLTDFYANVGTGPFSAPPTPIVVTAPDLDAAALDTPGLTAAENNPSFSPDRNLTLSLLPGETSEKQKEHQDLSLELPATGDTQRLQKQEMAMLTAPGQKLKTVQPVVVNSAPVKPPPSDTAEMVPDVSPIRARVDDPFDILNR